MIIRLISGRVDKKQKKSPALGFAQGRAYLHGYSNVVRNRRTLIEPDINRTGQL
jgi:hypothetical protein